MRKNLYQSHHMLVSGLYHVSETAKVDEMKFEKHVYGRTRKHELKSISNFDPRPPEFRDTLKETLQAFLDKVRGHNLGISVLLDHSMQVWPDAVSSADSSANIPRKEELMERVSQFIKSLQLTAARIRAIERHTTQQRNSAQWFEARRYRLTASLFGEVLRRRPETAPDALVLRIIQQNQFTSVLTEWGIKNEPVALKEYELYQKSHGHSDITICSAGFVIYESHPFLGASPDAYVCDTARQDQFGLVEIKCPYKYRDLFIEEACTNTDFCSQITVGADGTQSIQLKRNHLYYSQVQGQLAITGRTWCDFVLYTKKGLSIENITFDEHFWNNKLLPALDGFYRNCIAPAIVCPMHLVGMPMRDLRKD